MELPNPLFTLRPSAFILIKAFCIPRFTGETLILCLTHHNLVLLSASADTCFEQGMRWVLLDSCTFGRASPRARAPSRAVSLHHVIVCHVRLNHSCALPVGHRSPRLCPWDRRPHNAAGGSSPGPGSSCCVLSATCEPAQSLRDRSQTESVRSFRKSESLRRVLPSRRECVSLSFSREPALSTFQTDGT